MITLQRLIAEHEARGQLAQDELERLRESLLAAEERAHALELDCERAAAERAAERAAEAAAAAARPPPPEEVRKEMLRAFDGVASSICAEMANRAGVDAEGGEDAECVEMDSEAMVAQGLDAEALAEAYLRAVAERVATSVEPARLEAIDKWIKERKQRRTLQDQLQASLSLSHTHKSRTHTSLTSPCSPHTCPPPPPPPPELFHHMRLPSS